MASIAISNLHPAGADLFMDSESFMNELTDEQLNMTHGGATPGAAGVVIIIASNAFCAGVAVGVTLTVAAYYALK